MNTVIVSAWRDAVHACGSDELIAPCTNWKSFKYFHMDCFVNLQSLYNKRFAYHRSFAFMPALAEEANTLETLCLDYHPFTPRFPYDATDTFVGPLTHFHVLKHLRFPMPSLMGLPEMPMPLKRQLPRRWNGRM